MKRTAYLLVLLLPFFLSAQEPSSGEPDPVAAPVIKEPVRSIPADDAEFWDPEDYDEGRNFGHLAYRVDDIYALCQKLMDAGVTINRPPRDGHMAFVRSPDNISIELLQKGDALPAKEPWASMPNSGHW